MKIIIGEMLNQTLIQTIRTLKDGLALTSTANLRMDSVSWKVVWMQ